MIRESDILEESFRVAHDFRDQGLAALATVGHRRRPGDGVADGRGVLGDAAAELVSG